MFSNRLCNDAVMVRSANLCHFRFVAVETVVKGNEDSMVENFDV